MSKLIYVLDDDAGIRLLLEEVIKREGFRVKSFEYPEELREEVRKKAPDMMFIDYLLKGSRGDKIAAEIEQSGYSIPTILISGFAKDDIERAIESDTIVQILEKPFRVEYVCDILHNTSNVV
ncbi:hypothetical protein CEY16_07255 [Halalkalibacillus sediminis]|uniref:Response regulatory domain-containing protein n=1 Tax=Halalkalibacillus sediminis TaxID=2018042 RepID=A0A2I0QTP7_9BACI|nr:response regulator [Halalkalibacillus sediminis]PKR77722.1 hypothetical protein CEY16_07255 [Halalkalibacillus sediminis]